MTAKKDKRPVWTGDCETDPFRHGRVPKPFIWGLWTNAAFHEFDTPEQFVDFVKDCEAITYFHNGGKFDLHFLLQYINLHEDVKVINGRLVVAHIGKMEFRDSWNLLPIPLAEYKKDSEEDMRRALTAAGCDPNLAIDYGLMEETARCDPRVKRIIRDYLRNDCIFLHELITQFETDYGRHLTQASASLAQWRGMSGLKAPETDREYFAKFNKYYYGGRVECFQKGKINGPGKVVDIKSAYPDAMCSAHPYAPEYVEVPQPSDYAPTSMVTVECVSYGALPYRDERGAITFPNDGQLRRYHVPGHEITAGIDTGSITRVDLVHSIDFTDLISFADFINHFYELRKEAKLAGNRATDIFAKLLMNSLYGKFGANPDNYGNFQCVEFQKFEDYVCRCDNPKCPEYHFNGMIGPHALIRAPLDDWQCRFLNVATAASITSQVRAKLWRAIQSATDPYYCDTDSIICRHADVDIGPNLGQWEDEGTWDTLYIAGKKMYLCEGLDKLNPRTGKYEPKMATKGVRLKPRQIKLAALGREVTYKPQAPTFSLVREPRFVNRRIRAT
jgi:hypothetical protein